MDWESGLKIIYIGATILTTLWVVLKCSISCFKIDIGPIVMWFKMLSIITWVTFFGMFSLYCIIGN